MKRVKKAIMAAAVAAIATVGLSACGMVEKTQESIDGTVLAKVGTVSITQKDLDTEAKSYIDTLISQYGEEAVASDEGKQVVADLKKDLLASLVEMEILNLKAADYGLSLTSEAVTKSADERIESIKTIYGEDAKYVESLKSMGYTEESYKAFVTEEVLRGLVYDEIVKGVTATEEEAKAYYEENKAAYVEKAGATIYHIYFGTDAAAKAKADEAKAKLDAGAKFADIALEYGQDSTAEDGGELGSFAYDTDELLADFMDKVKPLKEGEISGVVQSTAGYHIITVKDVQAEDITPAFDEIKDDVTEELLAEKKQTKYEEQMTSWKTELKVTTYEDKII